MGLIFSLLLASLMMIAMWWLGNFVLRGISLVLWSFFLFMLKAFYSHSGLEWLERRIFNRPKASPPPDPDKMISLDDPIGAMAVVMNQYSSPRDLVFIIEMEKKIFNSNSHETKSLFSLAHGDPRPVAVGSLAVKMLLYLTKKRQEYTSAGSWEAWQEALWVQQVPEEYRAMIQRQNAA